MLKHENVVRLMEAFRRKEKLYLVFEYVDHSLLEIIEKYPKGIPEEKIKLYIYQMLKAIAFLHDMEIIHRDIKPENLLVDLKDNLKLCDFGFARAMNPKGGDMTHYVATRWYRSPELLITPGYGKEVDIWAIGCIMAEMIDGDPLFPGDDLIDQLDMIQSILGDVPASLKNMMMKNVELCNAKLRHVPNPETLERRYRGKVSNKGMKLMKALLIMDPKKRPTAKQALEFSYFDCFKTRRLESPHVINQRVLSSTYRPNPYSKMFDKRNASTDKRAPSYSQGRKKKKYKGRSESRGQKHRGDFLNVAQRNSGSFLMNSTKNHGFHDKKKKRTRKQKSNARKDFAIYTQNHFNKSRREDKEGVMISGIDTPEAASRRRKNTTKKSKNNFRMFRIKEESEYKTRGNVKRKAKSKKRKKTKKEDEQENHNGNFLPFLQGQAKKDFSGSNLSFYSRSLHYSKVNNPNYIFFKGKFNFGKQN